MMFKFFNLTSRRALVAETPLARFVHSASSSEKKRLYNHVIEAAVEEQRSVIQSYKKLHSPSHQAQIR